MADRDRQLLQLPTSVRERLMIFGGVLLLMGGLAIVTWNLVERSEQGIHDIAKVKIASISDQRVNSDVVQRHTADDQIRWECQNHPEARQLTYRALPVTDEGLKYLVPLKKVEQLNLSGTDVTDEGMERICHLPLKDLQIDGTQIADTGVIIVSKIKSLQQLDLSDTNVTSAGIATLEQLPELSDLNLSGDDKVDNEAIKSIGQSKSLQKLNISDTGVTADGLHYLSPRLFELHLGKIALTSTDATKPLRALKNLQELDLRGTELTDAGLKDICSLPHLLSLNLTGTNITDAGLHLIANAPALKYITLEACPKVSEAAVAKLRSAMPGLGIKHDRPWQQMSGDEMIGKFFKRNGGGGRPKANQ